MSFKLLVPTILAVPSWRAQRTPSDAEKGKDQFKKCIICHAITGPEQESDRASSAVVAGNPTEPGFSYSDAMQGFKHWDRRRSTNT